MTDQAFCSPLEFFETPREAVEPLLPLLKNPLVWVDLGCGRGAIGRVLAKHFGIKGIGVEFLPERAGLAAQTGDYAHVVRGDVADAGAWRRVQEALAHAVLEARGTRGLLVIANPPFQQWELFAERARQLTAPNATDEAAILLPAMAFERRKTNTQQYQKRANAIRTAQGRYDLALRPAFFREFMLEGQKVIMQKGEAPSAYAWLMYGVAHEGRWRWLEPDRPPKVLGVEHACGGGCEKGQVFEEYCTVCEQPMWQPCPVCRGESGVPRG